MHFLVRIKVFILWQHFSGKAVKDDIQSNFDEVVNWPIHRWADGVKAVDVTSVGEKIYVATEEKKV